MTARRLREPNEVAADMIEASLREVGPLQLGPLQILFKYEGISELLLGQLRHEAWFIMAHLSFQSFGKHCFCDGQNNSKRMDALWSEYTNGLVERLNSGQEGTVVDELQWHTELAQRIGRYEELWKSGMPLAVAYTRTTCEVVFESQGLNCSKYARAPMKEGGPRAVQIASSWIQAILPKLMQII